MYTAVERTLHLALILIYLQSTLFRCCTAVPRYELGQEENAKMESEQDTDGYYPDWLVDPFGLGNDTDYQADAYHIGRMMQEPRLRMLYSRTGYHLQLLKNGTVTGINSGSDKYAIVQIVSIRPPSVVAIRGVYGERYLAMNKKGLIYGTSYCPLTQRKTKNCHFSEAMNTGAKYNTYKSVKYPPKRKRPSKKKGKRPNDYYVALDRKGKPLNGPQTKPGRKSVLFLPRHLDDEASNDAMTYLGERN